MTPRLAASDSGLSTTGYGARSAKGRGSSFSASSQKAGESTPSASDSASRMTSL